MLLSLKTYGPIRNSMKKNGLLGFLLSVFCLFVVLLTTEYLRTFLLNICFSGFCFLLARKFQKRILSFSIFAIAILISVGSSINLVLCTLDSRWCDKILIYKYISYSVPWLAIIYLFIDRVRTPIKT